MQCAFFAGLFRWRRRADTAVTVFVFGFVMALALRYSRSLWAPIITHSANDFLTFVLFRL